MRCNTLQHTATHCNTLQHTATNVTCLLLCLLTHVSHINVSQISLSLISLCLVTRITLFFFLIGHCSTVQGLLDWFVVDLGFIELSFIQIDLCVLCVFVLYSRVSLSSCSFSDILHCLPRAAGVPLESALNLVSPMSPCAVM